MRAPAALVWLAGAAVLLSGQDAAPGLVSVPVSTDEPGRLEVDGEAQGLLTPGAPRALRLAPGDHDFAVYLPGAGLPPWRRKVLVSSALPVEVQVPLVRHQLASRIRTTGVWRDEATGLTWAGRDNRSGVTRSQARAYCAQLSLGGFSDWRLPEIGELQGLYGGPPDDRGLRLRAPLKLTGWAWSNTEGREPAENWALDFADGARASVVAGDAGPNRALCVR